ncbi:uncharacterized protein LOC112269245 [Brachypodium distachyon]|uniref:uncharacterized protein LOC112269245 n=1 Tax=Brachypodium distachyon TaxID=15368 RepID=UPI000D0D866B|nr:uncharacterized protein LOC112269245 [Brachypodium distachyon]|eukprot:XP_024311258.1 uncharacterized protein LOC112269245 [Brachypodium distachyon]
MPTALAPWPACKRASNNMFEVFNALPVGITEAADDSSETSSTTIHFKRKRPRKEIVPGHRPVTRSLKNSSNEEEDSACSGSYNLLRKDSPPTTDSEPDAREKEPHDFDPRCVEQVLAANETLSTEEKLAQLTAALQQKDDELAALRAQVGNNTNPELERNASTSQNSHQPAAAMNLEAIQKLITEGVKAQYMQTHYSMRPGYVKPYPPDVDLVPFPANYRQPQFSKFNGSGSPHEHIAHFLAACQDTAQNGALLLRQFVQTLSGPAFTWYSKLPPSLMRTWEQMQDAFLDRFYSTQSIVGITELTQTEQRVNEKAADFINRWRNLSLHCPQSLTEQEAVRMCTNNLNPETAMCLQGVRLVTFEDLASKATDIENYRQLTARRSKSAFKVAEKSGQHDKFQAKAKPAQAMETTVANPRFRHGTAPARNSEYRGEQAPRRPSLSERQKMEYSFPVGEVGDFLAGLLQLNLIELPKSKRPEEAAKSDDPNFCQYHRILGHTLKDCFVVKNIIQKLIDEGTIDTDLLKSIKKEKKTVAADVITLRDDLALPPRKISIKERLTFPPTMVHGQLRMDHKIGGSGDQNAVYYPK